MNGRMIPHGKYVPNKKEYSSGDVIVFSCDAGFELNSAPQLVCNRNGYWSAVFWPRCRCEYEFLYSWRKSVLYFMKKQFVKL